MALTGLLFWLAYVGGVCAAVFNPVVGVALYILVYHLNPETQWWGASVASLGLRTSFTVALATGIGILIRRPRMLYGARQFSTPMVLATLLVLLAIGSLAWGVDATERGAYQAEKVIKLWIFMMILVRCVRTPLHYQLVIYSWIVGVFYLGYQAYGGVGENLGGRLARGLGGPDFAESSGLGVHLVASLPLVGALFFMARTWIGRFFALATGALTVNMLVMTRTRNVLVGLFLMALTGVFSLPKGYRLRGLAAVVVGGLLAVQLTDPGWWRRMESLKNYEQDTSALLRIKLWHAGVQMAKDHPFGIGLGNFHHYVMDYIPELTSVRNAHNTVLTCLAELGWLGLLVYTGMLVSILWRLGRARKTAARLPPFHEVALHRFRFRFHLGWHAVALRAALIGYLGCAMFTTRLFSEDFWILVGFSACLHNAMHWLVAQEHEETGAEATDAQPAVTAAPPGMLLPPHPGRPSVGPAP